MSTNPGRLRNQCFICGGDPLVLSVPHPECPNSAQHVPCPEGYIAWWEWVDEMSKTHNSAQCSSCWFWVLLVPKVVGSRSNKPSCQS
jgi:hypothetical protein